MTAKRPRQNGEGSIYAYKAGYAAYVWVVTSEGRRQRKFVYGKTRKITHDRWFALQGQAQRGPVAPSSPILSDYLGRWLQDVVRPNLAPATSANDDLFVRHCSQPHLGARKVDKLAVRDVQTWLNLIRTRCQCCEQGKDARRSTPRCCAVARCWRQVPSNWTVHQAWTVLRSALSNAVRDEVVTRNVAALVRVPMPRPPRTRP